MEVKENVHFLAENKPEIGDTGSYLHSGIAIRSCERHFQLADHVQVVSASHIDGMLHLDLKSEVTEALKARRITFYNCRGTGLQRQQSNNYMLFKPGAVVIFFYWANHANHRT